MQYSTYCVIKKVGFKQNILKTTIFKQGSGKKCEIKGQVLNLIEKIKTNGNVFKVFETRISNNFMLQEEE